MTLGSKITLIRMAVTKGKVTMNTGQDVDK